jgi:GAF domain-containing protein
MRPGIARSSRASRAHGTSRCRLPRSRVLPSASDGLLAFVSLARLVSGDITLGDVLALSSNLILDIVPMASGAWYLPDAASGRLVAIDAFGPAADTLRGSGVAVGERVTGWVAASRQMVVNSAATFDLGERAALTQPPLSNCMSVPLIMGTSLAGVLTVYSSDQDTFDEQRGRLLQMIASHIAAVIHTAVQASAAKATSLTDAKSSAGGRELRLVSTR